MSAVIDWEAPPQEALDARRPGNARCSKLTHLAAELRASPGRWALVHVGASFGQASGMATHIRLGQVRAFMPAGDFDAVQHKGRVWARYVGEEDLGPTGEVRSA